MNKMHWWNPLADNRSKLRFALLYFLQQPILFMMKTSSYRRYSDRFPTISKRCGAMLLCVALASPAYADNESIKHLQKTASIAYYKMIQAKQSADNTSKDAAFAEKKLESLKRKLAVAEQEYTSIRKKLDQAGLTLERATQQWKQASDALALEWNKDSESR